MSEPIVLSEWREKQGKATASPSPSTLNTTSDEHGQMSIEDEILAVLNVYGVIKRARMQPFTTKSDFARMAANEVALAASEGFISTKVEREPHTATCGWSRTKAWLHGAVEKTVEDLDVPRS